MAGPWLLKEGGEKTTKYICICGGIYALTSENYMGRPTPQERAGLVWEFQGTNGGRVDHKLLSKEKISPLSPPLPLSLRGGGGMSTPHFCRRKPLGICMVYSGGGYGAIQNTPCMHTLGYILPICLFSQPICPLPLIRHTLLIIGSWTKAWGLTEFFSSFPYLQYWLGGELRLEVHSISGASRT